MKTIGKYQIQGELGRGGFGTVYRAWDPTVNRSVAIKVLTVQGDQDLLTRFRNEAAAAGNLHHRNIVTIHDFGEHNGVPYMVMQLLEGNTLQEAMTRKLPFTLIQKMNIMGQVAEGLHHAHLHGIVHRDVKPPNIMILPDESVQIMDFGIARLTASTSRQTRTGFVIGTVLYMAPEQFLPNKVVDHRADIWAYGVIYYEFLTGRHPFAAAEETSVLYQVAHVEPPPLRSIAPDCPQSLEDVINRLLNKDPDFRYQNLKDVQFDVQPILVELKRDRAQELVAEVRDLTGEGRLEEAQAAAQRILELDPSNREAQALLQQVRQRLQRRLIQPRINTMLQKAEQEVQSREFQHAIEYLEGALRLSGTDPAIEARLDQVKSLLDQSRRSERLLADAQREMRAQNLTAAFRIASEAVQTDPGNTSASHLISQIQHELDVRERQRQLEEGVNRARGMLLLQQYDEAISALDQMATDFPDDTTVADLLASARREKQHQERIDRRRKEIANVRDTLRQHRYESGVTTLEMLLAEFPADPEIKQLLGFARDEWQAHNRGQAIAKARAESDRLCGEARFDEALAVVEQVLSDYPGDASLVRLVQAVTNARTEYEERQRSIAVRQVLQQANEFERKGNAAGALQVLEAGLHDYPEAEALTAAAGRLRQIVAQQERREAIARHTASIESAISAGDFARAFSLIETARHEFASERVFDGLAARAANARNAAELEMARSRVRQELDDGNRERALELVAVALKRFPGDVQLMGIEREIRAAIAVIERQAREAAERKAAEERWAREEAERRAREEREQKAREEAEKRAREEAERKAQEEADRRARAEAERLAFEKAEAERKAREEADRRARAEAERLAFEKAEAERKTREEAERRARAEAERLAFEKAEAERKAREEAARAEAERKARKEAERKIAEERAQLERERQAREEAARLSAEQKLRAENERKAREEAERRIAEERAQLERERKEREELERKAQQQAAALAAEQKARMEAERKARAEAERIAAEERKAREAAERQMREDAARRAADEKARLEAERKAREEAERRAAEQRAPLDRERKAREEAERRASEERAQRERERKAREEAEKKARKAGAGSAVAAGAAAAPAPVQAPAADRAQRKPLPLILAGAALAIVGFAGSVYLLRSPRETVPPVVSQSKPQPDSSSQSPASSNGRTGTQPPQMTNPAKPVEQSPETAAVKTPPATPPPAKPKPDPVKTARVQPAPEQSREQPTENRYQPPPAENPLAQSTAGRVGDPGVRTSPNVQAPPAQAPTPAQQPATPSTAEEDNGPWRGAFNGRLQWAGTLPPGGRIVVNRDRVIQGPGQLTRIDLLPSFTRVEVTSLTPTGKITTQRVAPDRLMIENISAEEIRNIEVNWRVRK